MTEEKSILCVGMCVLDIIHVCAEYPIEDSDKRCLHGHWQRGGNASNNCTVLRQLGTKCEYLGVLSESKAFQYLIEDCMKRQIEISNCPKVKQDPPFSSVILNQNTNTRTIVHCNMNFPILKFDDFKKINLNCYKWIHFEARNPDETSKMIENILNFNQKSGTANIKISLELEKVKEENLILTENVDYVFLGKDLAVHFGWRDPKEAVYGLREKIANKSCCIISTWGEVGSGILDSSNKYTLIPSFPPTEIIDTLGAGDTFCATVLHCLSSGKSINEAVTMGNRVAGFKLSFYGYDKICDFNNN